MVAGSMFLTAGGARNMNMTQHNIWSIIVGKVDWEIEEISNGFIGYWNSRDNQSYMVLKEKDKTFFARNRKDVVDWIALEIFDEIRRTENEQQ
jgi:hypothetical protein